MRPAARVMPVFFLAAGDHNRGYLLFAEIRCCLQ
jgi:hypothetical protein